MEALAAKVKDYEDKYDNFLESEMPCYVTFLIMCAALCLYGSCTIFALESSPVCDA